MDILQTYKDIVHAREYMSYDFQTVSITKFMCSACIHFIAIHLFSVSSYKNRKIALPMNTFIHTDSNIYRVEFSRDIQNTKFYSYSVKI